MPKFKPLPPLERLNELFEIVEIPPEKFGEWSGLIWKVGRQGTKGIGSVAGFLIKCHKTPSRFVWHVKINQKTYLASRVIYYMENRVDPGDLEVDHRDRNTFNNNVRNLRLLSSTLQKHNRGLQSNNTSGVAGVNWYKKQASGRPGLHTKAMTFGSVITLAKPKPSA